MCEVVLIYYDIIKVTRRKELWEEVQKQNSQIIKIIFS